MPISTISDVPANEVDRVSRSFRVNDAASVVVQELQPNGKWTVRAEHQLAAAAGGTAGMLVIAAHRRDRSA